MKHWHLALFLLFFTTCTRAQDFSKTMHNAFLITRMVEKFHLQPKPLNDELSTVLFQQFLHQLDEGKTLFLSEDIRQLSSFRFNLDEAIAQRQTNFLQQVSAIYQQRIKQNDSLIKIICKTPFNFSLPDKLTKADDTTWTSSLAAKQSRLSKYLKWKLLDEITDDAEFLKLLPAAQKKFLDSAEAAERKRTLVSTGKKYTALLQTQKLTSTIGNLFCKTLAHYYDPHTTFMPADEKEEFDEELGQKPLRFGLGLDDDEQGGVIIRNLLPGSSAFKSGLLNTGDKVISIQEPGKAAINVSSFTFLQIDSVMNETTGEKLLLTVKKPDGTSKQVSLLKERFATEEDEEDKVQGYVLKGVKTIGYISIPDFYIDWDDAEKGIAGCANDVAKEIIKLKKENIEGLIIDIRYNGGGSLGEAIDLSGIFIDGGPVGQYKTKLPKPLVLKDGNSGRIYEGPLLIMVNGYSASASEMFSGTLQDYNRAVIVGTPTYGKATGQIVLPMDTMVTEETIDRFKTENYLKVTTFGLYRVNGTTAQKNGVEPDVELPDLLQIVGENEKNEQFAFTLSPLEANKYYRPFAAIAKTDLRNKAKLIVDTSLYFRNISRYDQLYKQMKAQTDFSLKLDDVIQIKKKQQEFLDYFENFSQASFFTIDNYNLNKERLKASEWLTELDNETKEAIRNDPYINICYQLILQIKQ
jgi:carboxyl-terminal processing protease